MEDKKVLPNYFWSPKYYKYIKTSNKKKVSNLSTVVKQIWEQKFDERKKQLQAEYAEQMAKKCCAKTAKFAAKKKSVIEKLQQKTLENKIVAEKNVEKQLQSFLPFIGNEKVGDNKLERSTCGADKLVEAEVKIAEKIVEKELQSNRPSFADDKNEDKKLEKNTFANQIVQISANEENIGNCREFFKLKKDEGLVVVQDVVEFEPQNFPAEGPYMCEICRTIVQTKVEYLSHVEQYHTGDLDEEFISMLKQHLEEENEKVIEEFLKGEYEEAQKAAQIERQVEATRKMTHKIKAEPVFKLIDIADAVYDDNGFEQIDISLDSDSD